MCAEWKIGNCAPGIVCTAHSRPFFVHDFLVFPPGWTVLILYAFRGLWGSGIVWKGSRDPCWCDKYHGEVARCAMRSPSRKSQGSLGLRCRMTFTDTILGKPKVKWVVPVVGKYPLFSTGRYPLGHSDGSFLRLHLSALRSGRWLLAQPRSRYRRARDIDRECPVRMLKLSLGRLPALRQSHTNEDCA